MEHFLRRIVGKNIGAKYARIPVKKHIQKQFILFPFPDSDLCLVFLWGQKPGRRFRQPSE
jgi:hypothetical protein